MSINSRHESAINGLDDISSKHAWEGVQTCLGIFPAVDTAVEALKELQQQGIPREQLSVISSVPYPHGVFPINEPKVHLPKISVAGGVLGFAGGTALIALTSLAYPIKTGHMPIVPILPTSLLAFEFMMLGIVLFTLGGLVIGAKLTKLKPRIYDPLLSQGHIGILILCKLPDQAETAKKTLGELMAEKVLLTDGNDL